MAESANGLTLTVPLTERMKRVASRVARARQYWGASSRDERQIYLNVLAVLVMDFYLQYLKIDTDLELSEIWQFGSKTRPSDLPVRGWGRLECCAVTGDSHSVEVSFRNDRARVGYVAVWFDENTNIAKPIGFLDRTTDETRSKPLHDRVPFSQWQPLEQLLERTPSRHQKQTQDGLDAISLTSWAKHLYQNGWQAIESLSDPPWELSWNFRSHHHYSASSCAANRIEGVKVLDFAPYSESIVLLVGFNPNAMAGASSKETRGDRQEVKAGEEARFEPPLFDRTETDVWVRLYPKQDCQRLPYALTLQVLDLDNIPVMQATARRTRSLQLEFSGEVGELFRIKVELEGISITEVFSI
ncbi:MAG: DUF1822 family protein [Cyanobacteria bacterium SID2]|nr:DUF1822 family protein [Cyanobacteria bacterium SID2]